MKKMPQIHSAQAPNFPPFLVTKSHAFQSFPPWPRALGPAPWAPRAPRTRTAAMSAPPARPRAATSDQRLHSARVAARNPDILQMPNYRALTHTCVGRVVTSLGSQVRKLRPRKAKRLDQVAQLARGRARLHASATRLPRDRRGRPYPGEPASSIPPLSVWNILTPPATGASLSDLPAPCVSR